MAPLGFTFLLLPFKQFGLQSLIFQLAGPCYDFMHIPAFYMNATSLFSHFACPAQGAMVLCVLCTLPQ